MNFPSRETVERLRREYPVGCRIVLDEMDDPYTMIPIGAQATCQGVDDAGNILCAWDSGSGLSIAFVFCGKLFNLIFLSPMAILTLCIMACCTLVIFNVFYNVADKIIEKDKNYSISEK